ncbi:hypothetical protein NCH01_13390 [Neoasaia chiangmaiensis]|nr:hypothetical protein NCH01_13390 [Neoasaia chiangmaiensis]
MLVFAQFRTSDDIQMVQRMDGEPGHLDDAQADDQQQAGARP